VDIGQEFALEKCCWPSQAVGRGGALVESIFFDRRVVGLNPALAAT